MSKQHLDESAFAVLDLVATATLILQRDTIRYANPEAHRLLEQHELRDQSFLQYVHEDYHATVEAWLQQRESVPPTAIRMRHSFLHYRWMECTLNPVTFKGGAAHLATMSENTLSLWENIYPYVELLESIHRNVREGIFRSSLGDELIYANEAFARMFGYNSIQEVLTIPPSILYDDPADRERLEQLIAEEGFCENEDVRFIRKDGRRFWGAVSVTQTRDTDGQLRYFDGTIIDITERRQAQRQLEQLVNEVERQKRLLDEILTATPDHVILYDPDGRYIYMNQAGLNASNFALEHILGKTPREIGYPEAPLRLFESHFQQVLETGEMLKTEVDYPQDEQTLMLEMVYAPLRNKDGALVGIVSIVRDVTERKDAERAQREREVLAVALDKERELSTLKDQMVTTISHEFRTPLSIILSSSQLLDQYFYRLSEEKRTFHLRKIKEQIGNLTNMLNDLSLVAEARFDRVEPHPGWFDLERMCRATVAEVEATFGVHHELLLETDGEDHQFFGDQVLLRRALLSLLSNAVKYSPSGSTIRVQLEIDQYDGVDRLSVQDEGLGIPPQDQDRIFEPFHRGSNIKSIGGTGLGLTIVRDAVDLHHGSIHVESAPEGGSRFTLRLPILRKH